MFHTGRINGGKGESMRKIACVSGAVMKDLLKAAGVLGGMILDFYLSAKFAVTVTEWVSRYAFIPVTLKYTAGVSVFVICLLPVNVFNKITNGGRI